MMNALLKALEKDNKERKTEAQKFICKKESENGLKFYSTTTKWTQFQNGTITREEAEQYAIKRAFKKIDKDTETEQNRITVALNLAPLKSISISVEWVKSRTWGANPNVTVIASDVNGKYYRYYGSASGCGYDKESAATGEALNQLNALLQDLYKVKNKALYKDNKTTSHSCLGYGSGYGILPYFESGVGFSCHESILNKCGFKIKNRTSGKTYTYYYFERV